MVLQGLGRLGGGAQAFLEIRLNGIEKSKVIDQISLLVDAKRRISEPIADMSLGRA